MWCQFLVCMHFSIFHMCKFLMNIESICGREPSRMWEEPSSRDIPCINWASMLWYSTWRCTSLRADMLKAHKSDGKQLVTAPFRSACQSKLGVCGCCLKLGVTLGWRRCFVERWNETCCCKEPDYTCAAIGSRHHPWRATNLVATIRLSQLSISARTIRTFLRSLQDRNNLNEGPCIAWTSELQIHVAAHGQLGILDGLVLGLRTISWCWSYRAWTWFWITFSVDYACMLSRWTESRKVGRTTRMERSQVTWRRMELVSRHIWTLRWLFWTSGTSSSVPSPGDYLRRSMNFIQS